MQHRHTRSALRAALILLTCPLLAAADPLVVAPSLEGGRGIAVIVDLGSFEALQPELERYRADLADAGYSAWLVVDDWARPEAVRAEIEALYRKPEARLEGLFLVGDIPVAMLRDAQFLTSAFKMDQDRYPPIDSSVPSDRYYDDFDLRFAYIERDASDPLLHYLRYQPGSAVRIDRELYSGRLTPRGGTPAERHEALRRYFRKLAAAKAAPETLDRVLMAMGHGYVMESLSAYQSDTETVREMLGHGAEATFRLDAIAQLYEDEVKPRLLKHWTEPSLDFALVRCHGSYDAAHIDPPKPSEEDQAEDGDADAEEEPAEEPWDLKSAEMAVLPCGAEMLMFDACFTGSFAHEGYLASMPLFGNADTVVTIANSRNVRQDIWTTEELGLLRSGCNVGQMHQRIRFLESHLFGDPTYTFVPAARSSELPRALETGSTETLVHLLDGAADPVARMVAAERLASSSGAAALPELRRAAASDASACVRLRALEQLARLRPAGLTEDLIARLDDPDPLVRRFAAILVSDIGDPACGPSLARLSVNDPCRRCRWIAARALETLGGEWELAALQASADLAASVGLVEEETAYRERAQRALGEASDAWGAESLASEDPAKRRSGVRTLRGNRYRAALDTLLGVLANDPDRTVRVTAAEALGWWCADARRPEIEGALEAVLAEPGADEALHSAATIALARLRSGYNVYLVP